MNAQTERAARRCEEAQGQVCHCRCGGKLHGINRAGVADKPTPREFFEQLPEDDPHFVPSEEWKRAQAKKAQELNRARSGGGRLA